MSRADRFRAQRAAEELEEPVAEAANLAEKLGLDPYRVNYWIVDHDEMNELIAYNGFQERYPHWRWGMAYERQRKQGQFLGGKAFEIVNNDDPAHAFLQESNAIADQKAVITHVEAHSDFFANNQWFGLFNPARSDPEAPRRGPDASAMLARHGETIGGYMSDPEIDRADVERWIDHLLCVEDVIDQYQAYKPIGTTEAGIDEADLAEIADQLDDLDVSEDVRRQVFDTDWLEAQREDGEPASFPEEPESDLLGFLSLYGKQYDEDVEKATEMEEWQREIIEIVRREAHYFAPQRMTKVMNEGWASYWESTMMAGEAFAGADEFVLYADHMSKVLGSPGMNPYKLGLEMWTYVENSTNRREVVENLLRVDGIGPANFHDDVDFAHVRDLLAADPEITDVVEHVDLLDADDPRVDATVLDHYLTDPESVDVEEYPWKLLTFEGLAERHYSLVKPQHRGFVERISRRELDAIDRYMFDDARFDTVEEAIDAVDYARGWNRMFEIRESHNDVTFVDEFLSQEFVDENNYFTYEYTRAAEEHRVTSTDYEDVKKKLLLQLTNFGNPTITVEDGNYRNRNELLLGHRYNGVALDIEQAKATLERVFELWGRPVSLLTIDKQYDDHDVEVARRREREPEPEEVGKRIRYDGEETTVDLVEWEEVEHLAADDVDYDTKPEEWLA
mgnify:CR=1 FL=1